MMIMVVVVMTTTTMMMMMMMITEHGLCNCLTLSFSYETAAHLPQRFLADISKYC
jgi:hypothetical protein